MVKYVSTNTKVMLKERFAENLSNDAYAMFVFSFYFFMKAYVVCTHLNCMNNLMQLK